jgi:hypothetical protein
VQEQPWKGLLQQRSRFHKLWPLTEGSVTDILSRIDDPEFIHLYSTAESRESGQCASLSGPSIQRASDCQEKLRFHLPRLNLHFEVTPGSDKLHSVDFADYFIAESSSLEKARSVVGPELQRLAPLPLPLLLENFLVLVSDKPLPMKVLIPDAFYRHASQVPASFVCTPSDPHIEHHVYSFHPYTGNLDAAEVQSRLHLAALHAHCSSSVPLPGLGMTGGEHALQLLRQSWVNRPFSVPEAEKLNALTAASAHTPALQLMCEKNHAATVSLSFLHDTTLSMQSHDDWLASNLPQKGSVMCAYRQAHHRPAQFGAVCSRCTLTDEEAEGIMTEHVGHQQRTRQSRACMAHTVSWGTLKQLESWKKTGQGSRRRLMHHLRRNDQSKADMHSEMRFLAEKFLRTRNRKTDDLELVNAFVSELTELIDNEHQKRAAMCCQESLMAYSSLPPESEVPVEDLEDVHEALDALHSKLKKELDSLALFLVEAMASCPKGHVHGPAMRAFQASALASKPALADFIRVTTQDGFLKVRLFLYKVFEFACTLQKNKYSSCSCKLTTAPR